MGGRLSLWSAERAIASGLDGAAHGELVEIEGAGPALVTALLADRVELAPLSPRVARIGAEVRSLGPLATPAGEDLVGRTVDALGRALDGGPPIDRAVLAPIFGRDPAIDRAALAPISGPSPERPGWIYSSSRRLTLGALVYDLQRVIGLGSSLLAFGPDVVLPHVLRHQVAVGRVVVLATPASTSAEHRDLWRGASPAHPAHPREEPVRCIHVAAEHDATPAQQWLVPWTAMAIASSLRARGRDVVVALHRLDEWRPHVRVFPARGSWATQLAQLAARAYACRTGSVSLIGMTRRVTATRASAFDGMLDLSLAVRGELPPTGTKLVRPPIRVPSLRRLGGACLSACELAGFERTGCVYPRSVLGREQRLWLDHARRLRECLRFRVGGTIDSLEQELSLLAVEMHPEILVYAVTDFVDAYLARLRRDHAGRLAAIRTAARMDEDDERTLLAVADTVAATFVG